MNPAASASIAKLARREPAFIPRGKMPQVDDLIGLIDFIAAEGIPASIAELPATATHVHQHVEEAFIPPPDSPLLHKPLLLSADHYILDGNHRAAAHRRYGTQTSAIIIDLNFWDALQLLFRFPQTYTYGDHS